MRFLYKIHSGYDGFRPAVLPDRMENGRLQLGFRHYIDVVEEGWECWLYFHGPHRFENGVYAKGTVEEIDLGGGFVTLRVSRFLTDQPLTTRSMSALVAEAVATRFRQVFLWPEELELEPRCNIASCFTRLCGECSTWKNQPRIVEGQSAVPSRLRKSAFKDVVAAHWIVPRRCYEKNVINEIRHLTRRFTEFKLGEMAYAYPFALSMFEQLERRGLLSFDYVVPIPLSPDKAKKREKHRTKELAKELSRLLGVRLREMLKLSSNVSKRRMQKEGRTIPQFEKKYRLSLQASVPSNANRILLVDDVMTRGSTVAQALAAVGEQRPLCEIVVVTVGQMIVKEAVIDDQGFKSQL